MSYQYRIYGLNVKSELQISEAYEEDFVKAGKNADVHIVLADMPEKIKQAVASYNRTGDILIKGKDFIFFRIDNVAEYFVQASEILVSAFCEVASQPVKTFLLGTAFGLCMALNNIVALHGGAVGKNGTGIIITGESGAGKSTITNSLLSRGWEFVADDVCSLSINGQRAHINMAYPQQKLCRDAALNMGYQLDELIYINESRDKFAVRLQDGYLSDGVTFSQLYEIRLSDDSDKGLTITKLEGMEKLQSVMGNIYRRNEAFDRWGNIPPEYFKQCLMITQYIDAYRIERPAAKDTTDEIMRLIEQNNAQICACDSNSQVTERHGY